MDINKYTKAELLREALDLGLQVSERQPKAVIAGIIESFREKELADAVEAADSSETVYVLDGKVEAPVEDLSKVDMTDDMGNTLPEYDEIASLEKPQEGHVKTLEEIIRERKAESDAMYERKAKAEEVEARLGNASGNASGTTAPADTFQKVQQTEEERAKVAKRIADIIAQRKDLKTPKNSIEDIIRDRKIKAGVMPATLEEVLAERRKKIR